MSELYETKTTYQEIAKEWREAARDYTHHWEFWLIMSLANMLVIAGHVYSAEFSLRYPLLNAAGLVVALYIFSKEWGVHNA